MANGDDRGIAVTGTTFLVMIVTVPMVLVWLALAAWIVYSATMKPEVLDNIEGLLTALAVLTLPVGSMLGSLYRHWEQEQANSNGGTSPKRPNNDTTENP